MIKNTPKKIVHTFSKDNRTYNIYVQTEQREGNWMYVLLKETDVGPLEVPFIQDYEEMEEWLEGTGLTLEELEKKVSAYNVWE